MRLANVTPSRPVRVKYGGDASAVNSGLNVVVVGAVVGVVVLADVLVDVSIVVEDVRVGKLKEDNLYVTDLDVIEASVTVLDQIVLLVIDMVVKLLDETVRVVCVDSRVCEACACCAD